MKSILDQSFRYTPSGQTDLRKTFARIRREKKLNGRATVDNRVPTEIGKVAQFKRSMSK